MAYGYALRVVIWKWRYCKICLFLWYLRFFQNEGCEL